MENKQIIYKSKLILCIFVVFLFFAPDTNVLAQADNEIMSERSPHIQFGDIITIDKEINGDAYLFGNDILIDAPINGDLYVVTSNLRINAPISGSVRALSEKLDLRALIGGSLSFINDYSYISSTGEVAKDVYGITSKLLNEGRIGGNLNMSFSPQSEIVLNGNIIGDLIIQDVRPEYGDTSFIQGDIVKIKPELEENESKFAVILLKLFHSFLLITIAWIYYRFWNKNFIKITNTITKQPVRNIAYGLALLFILPAMLFLLTVTIIGIPVVTLIFSLLVIIFFITPIYFGFLIGEKIIGSNKYPTASLIIGIMIFDVLTLIPSLGLFLNISMFVVVLGALINIFSRKKVLSNG